MLQSFNVCTTFDGVEVNMAAEKIKSKKLFGWSNVAPLLVVLGLVGIFVALELHSPLPDPGEPLSGNLPKVKEKAVDILLNLTNLLITWSVSIIGATAFFLKGALEGKTVLSRRSLIMAELVTVFSIVSLFFGHLVFSSVLNMLALDVLSVRDSAVLAFGIAQYGAFLVSVALFGLYVHYTYWPISTHS